MTTETALPNVTCKQCGHGWIIRTVEPVRCPKCMTRRWRESATAKGE